MVRHDTRIFYVKGFLYMFLYVYKNMKNQKNE